MSLRVRLGLAAGAAVALAVVAVVATAYAGTRSELQGQVDASLHQLSRPILARAGLPPGIPGGPPDGGPGRGDRGLGDRGPGGSFGGSVPGGSLGGSVPGGSGAAGTACGSALGLAHARGPGFGAAEGYLQLIDPHGRACLPSRETTQLPVDAADRALARSGHGSRLSDATVHSTHLRVLAVGVGRDGAVQVALPLRQVDDALASQLLLLAVIAAGGVALAALLGVLVARTALAPIARFTRQTEAISARPERLESERLQASGSDELARLARTFNRTLDVLADSVRAQRNLVADASHELRTPIATIRANLQLMRDEARLMPADREALRRDIIEELDELTALVADVVELARGSKPVEEPGEVRLDAVVEDALTRTRRRAPELGVQAELAPTVIRGEGDRIQRAVANLLDNAIKWSPAGGAIEVGLADGVLSVRDHGPGFEAADMPYVFDRFHRSRAARATSGSGLGLAIVRQAADAHGGWVSAANAPDGGAIMRISFGAVIAPAPSPADEPQRAGTGS
ncbi:MAG: HAMP domain-containing histidine kinase [Solirubrobacterales bacterium]|nr:HAMP domain-containing histidine kinase [Solirubrobacterales bacterium]